MEAPKFAKSSGEEGKGLICILVSFQNPVRTTDIPRVATVLHQQSFTAALCLVCHLFHQFWRVYSFSNSLAALMVRVWVRPSQNTHCASIQIHSIPLASFEGLMTSEMEIMKSTKWHSGSPSMLNVMVFHETIIRSMSFRNMIYHEQSSPITRTVCLEETLTPYIHGFLFLEMSSCPC